MTQADDASAPDRSRDTRVVVVGAGPIGVELSAALKRHGVGHLVLEAGCLGNTIAWWAPGTRWFSSNERIAIAGVPLHTPDQSKATREQYLTYLRGVVDQFGLPVHCHCPVRDVRGAGTGWTVHTSPQAAVGPVRCEVVVLATGGLDHPRRLGIDGEDLPHVDGKLREPHGYWNERVLVVGGRNSAVEAALRLHHAGARVALSYRGPALPEDHIKYWLLPEIRGLIRSGRIDARFGTRPLRITPHEVVLADEDGAQSAVAADHVLTLIGYEQDKSLFRRLGVSLEGDGLRPHVDEATMRTDVPGIHVAGTGLAGTQSSGYKLFLENCHAHVDRIVADLTGAAVDASGRDYADQARLQPES